MALRKVTDVHERTYSSAVYQTRIRFVMGKSKNPPATSPWISEKQYERARKLQSSKPISVGTLLSGKPTWHKIRVRGKTLWWYKDGFHVVREHSREDIKGLTQVAGVHQETDDASAGRQPYDIITWWRKLTGVNEKSAEGPLPREDKRYRFAIGTSQRSPRTPWIAETVYHKASQLQSAMPVSVGITRGGRKTRYNITLRDKTLWWHKGEFYVEKHYSPGKPRKEGATELTTLHAVREERAEDSYLRSETRYCFSLGTELGAPGTSPGMSRKEYHEAKKLQSSEPVSVGTIDSGRQKGKSLWWYEDEFYVENDGYTSEEVQLLLWEREQRRKSRFQRLKKEMLSERALEGARRERIPEDVRIFVWRRDEGRCVQCGSQENLEFDHIIPGSKGGSNTARNIQLLCETCNRRKSANL